MSWEKHSHHSHWSHCSHFLAARAAAGCVRRASIASISGLKRRRLPCWYMPGSGASANPRGARSQNAGPAAGSRTTGPALHVLNDRSLFVRIAVNFVNQFVDLGVGGGNFAPSELACSAPVGRLIASSAPSSRTEPSRTAFMLSFSASTRSASSTSQWFDGPITASPEGSAHRCSSTTSLSIRR